MSGHVDEFIVVVLMQLGLQSGRCIGSEGTQHMEKVCASVINSLSLVRILFFTIAPHCASLDCSWSSRNEIFFFFLSIPKIYCELYVMNSKSSVDLLQLTLDLCVAGFGRQTGSGSFAGIAKESDSGSALTRGGSSTSAGLWRITRAHPVSSYPALEFVQVCWSHQHAQVLPRIDSVDNYSTVLGYMMKGFNLFSTKKSHPNGGELCT